MIYEEMSEYPQITSSVQEKLDKALGLLIIEYFQKEDKAWDERIGCTKKEIQAQENYGNNDIDFFIGRHLLKFVVTNSLANFDYDIFIDNNSSAFFDGFHYQVLNLISSEQVAKMLEIILTACEIHIHDNINKYCMRPQLIESYLNCISQDEYNLENLWLHSNYIPFDEYKINMFLKLLCKFDYQLFLNSLEKIKIPCLLNDVLWCFKEELCSLFENSSIACTKTKRCWNNKFLAPLVIDLSVAKAINDFRRDEDLINIKSFFKKLLEARKDKLDGFFLVYKYLKYSLKYKLMIDKRDNSQKVLLCFFDTANEIFKECDALKKEREKTAELLSEEKLERLRNTGQLAVCPEVDVFYRFLTEVLFYAKKDFLLLLKQFNIVITFSNNGFRKYYSSNLLEYDHYAIAELYCRAANPKKEWLATWNNFNSARYNIDFNFKTAKEEKNSVADSLKFMLTIGVACVIILSHNKELNESQEMWRIILRKAIKLKITIIFEYERFLTILMPYHIVILFKFEESFQREMMIKVFKPLQYDYKIIYEILSLLENNNIPIKKVLTLSGCEKDYLEDMRKVLENSLFPQKVEREKIKAKISSWIKDCG